MRLNYTATKYIPVTEEVRDTLNTKKLVPRESYDDVIRRLLQMPERKVVKNN